MIARTGHCQLLSDIRSANESRDPFRGCHSGGFLGCSIRLGNFPLPRNESFQLCINQWRVQRGRTPRTPCRANSDKSKPKRMLSNWPDRTRNAAPHCAIHRKPAHCTDNCGTSVGLVPFTSFSSTVCESGLGSTSHRQIVPVSLLRIPQLIASQITLLLQVVVGHVFWPTTRSRSGAGK